MTVVVSSSSSLARSVDLVPYGVRLNVLNTILKASFTVGLIFFGISIVRFAKHGWQDMFLAVWPCFTLIALLFALRHRLSAGILSGGLWALWAALNFAAHYFVGIASIGPVFFFMAAASAAIGLAFHWLAILVGLQVLSVLGITFLTYKGIHVPMPENGVAYLTSTDTWLVHTLAMTIGATLVLYSLAVFVHWTQLALRTSRRSFYYGMSLMSLARDNETGAHIDRCSRYACQVMTWLTRASVAVDMPFDPEDLANAVQMHDLGKVAVPDEILLKPGRLTQSEMEIMRKHCEIGAQIISRVRENANESDDNVLVLAQDIALSHHENWDGTGYPHHLSGTQISLPARIMALCDVYDALRSERAYKKAWTHEATVAEMLGMTGKFDPTLLELFARHHQDFADIYARTNVTAAIGLQTASWFGSGSVLRGAA